MAFSWQHDLGPSSVLPKPVCEMFLLIQLLFETGYRGSSESLSVGQIYVSSFKSFSGAERPKNQKVKS